MSRSKKAGWIMTEKQYRILKMMLLTQAQILNAIGTLVHPEIREVITKNINAITKLIKDIEE
jgi:hypothetical protein